VESESEGILGGVGVGRNFRWSRKEFLGVVGVVKKCTDSYLNLKY
jgi:hypothetical protein